MRHVSTNSPFRADGIKAAVRERVIQDIILEIIPANADLFEE